MFLHVYVCILHELICQYTFVLHLVVYSKVLIAGREAVKTDQTKQCRDGVKMRLVNLGMPFLSQPIFVLKFESCTHISAHRSMFASDV